MSFNYSTDMMRSLMVLCVFLIRMKRRSPVCELAVFALPWFRPFQLQPPDYTQSNEEFTKNCSHTSACRVFPESLASCHSLSVLLPAPCPHRSTTISPLCSRVTSHGFKVPAVTRYSFVVIRSSRALTHSEPFALRSANSDRTTVHVRPLIMWHLSQS